MAGSDGHCVLPISDHSAENQPLVPHLAVSDDSHLTLQAEPVQLTA